MREINKEKRFLDIKSARFYIDHYEISPKFYLDGRRAILGELTWEEVFKEVSFDDCVGFLEMKIYERGNVYFLAIERMVNLIFQEKGEKKYWLLIRTIPFLQNRRLDGLWRYVTQEIKEKLAEIFEGIENDPDYVIFLWASNGEGYRCLEGKCRFVDMRSIVNEVNLKAEKVSGNKALKIKYLKEKEEKFRLKD